VSVVLGIFRSVYPSIDTHAHIRPRPTYINEEYTNEDKEAMSVFITHLFDLSA